MAMDIIIFGTMGSGKDSVARLIQLIAHEHDYVIGKLGGKIRTEVDSIASDDASKRQLYQDYGEAMRDLFGKDYWNTALQNQLEEVALAYPTFNFIIADGRQPHEMEYWTSRGFTPVGVTATQDKRINRLMERDGVDQTNRLNHITEITAVECVQGCKYIVENNGSFEDLMDSVKTLMDEIVSDTFSLEDDMDDSEN